MCVLYQLGGRARIECSEWSIWNENIILFFILGIIFTNFNLNMKHETWKCSSVTENVQSRCTWSMLTIHSNDFYNSFQFAIFAFDVRRTRFLMLDTLWYLGILYIGFRRSSTFSSPYWITSYVHAPFGFDTSHAQMPIVHLLITCMESICTNPIIFGKGHVLVIISQKISTNPRFSQIKFSFCELNTCFL